MRRIVAIGELPTRAVPCVRHCGLAANPKPDAGINRTSPTVVQPTTALVGIASIKDPSIKANQTKEFILNANSVNASHACIHVHPMCVVAVGPLWTPPPDLLRQISSSTLRNAPNLPSHGLRATIFSVELGAKSCDQQGFPPRLSRTARKLPVHGQSLLQVIGQTF
jgi:hypothetical protein